MVPEGVSVIHSADNFWISHALGQRGGQQRSVNIKAHTSTPKSQQCQTIVSESHVPNLRCLRRPWQRIVPAEQLVC